MESFTIKKMTFLRQISILMVVLAVKLTGDVKYYDIFHFYKFICIASFDVTSGNFNSHKDYEDEDFSLRKYLAFQYFHFIFSCFSGWVVLACGLYWCQMILFTGQINCRREVVHEERSFMKRGR